MTATETPQALLARISDKSILAINYPDIRDLHRELAASLAREAAAEVMAAKLREALFDLVSHAHNCEQELTEDLHHCDFCGESFPLTNARAVLEASK